MTLQGNDYFELIWPRLCALVTIPYSKAQTSPYAHPAVLRTIPPFLLLQDTRAIPLTKLSKGAFMSLHVQLIISSKLVADDKMFGPHDPGEVQGLESLK